MKQSEFRKELKKVMPGYKWTIHRPISDLLLEATGIKSAGMSRTSTLFISRREKNGEVSYSAKSAGYSCNAPWLGVTTGGTLKQAIRNLQTFYENKAHQYSQHGYEIQSGRLI